MIRQLEDFTSWFEDFTFWFERTKNVNEFEVLEGNLGICILRDNGNEDPPIGRFNDSKKEDEDTKAAIIADFEKFKSRPEYAIGQTHEERSELSEQEYYTLLLEGAALVRAKKNGLENPDQAQDSINRLIVWLESTDFFRSPASTRYHEPYEGGLLHHTIQVVNNIIDLKKLKKFHSVDLSSAVLVALVHDWCKINSYESYDRNVKNPNTGKWEQVKAFRKKDAWVPLGHGVQSMYMAMNNFRLSIDESAAIRWHQGVWNTCSAEYNDLQQANETYPLVHMLQFADQLAITRY